MLYKRGSTWWCCFVREGIRYRKSMSTSNRRLAADRASAFRNKVVNVEFGIRERVRFPTFGEVYKEMIEKLADKRRASTIERYGVASVPLLRTFKNTRIDQISIESVEKYMRQRTKTKSRKTGRVVEGSTVNREIATARRALVLYAKKETRKNKQFTLFNPFATVEKYAEPEGRDRVVTHAEEAQYLRCCTEPLHSIALLLVETGMRVSEVVALKKADVHPTYVEVTQSKTKSGRRQIPLTPRARAVLDFRVAIAKGPWVFPAKSDPNEHMRKPNNGHAAALKRSGVAPFRLHDLRHTFASRTGEWARALDLREILGHAKIDMTKRYYHGSKEHHALAIAQAHEHNEAERAKVVLNADSPQNKPQRPN